MDWATAKAVSNIEICDVLQYVCKELSVRVDNRAVNRTAKVLCKVLLQHSRLAKVNLSQSLTQTIEMLLGVAIYP